MPQSNEILMPAPFRVEVKRGGDTFTIEQNQPIDPNLLLEIASLVLAMPPSQPASGQNAPRVEVFNPRAIPSHRAQFEEAQARRVGNNTGAP